MTPKYAYRVKPGCVHGAFQQFGSGSTVELTEEEADGLQDKLELVKGDGTTNIPVDEVATLSKMTALQLKELPEYAKLGVPKPKGKEAILNAILDAKGLLDPVSESE